MWTMWQFLVGTGLLYNKQKLIDEMSHFRHRYLYHSGKSSLELMNFKPLSVGSSSLKHSVLEQEITGKMNHKVWFSNKYLTPITNNNDFPVVLTMLELQV